MNKNDAKILHELPKRISKYYQSIECKRENRDVILLIVFACRKYFFEAKWAKE